MTKRMLIDASHAEETRVVVLDGNRLEDFDVETSTKRQLKGNIYLAKVVRVEPSLQAAFVEYGGGRHGFLAFDEIHPDYYQIPVADRQRLIAMQAEEAEREAAEEDRAAEAEATNEAPTPVMAAEPAEEAVAEAADAEPAEQAEAAATHEELVTEAVPYATAEAPVAEAPTTEAAPPAAVPDDEPQATSAMPMAITTETVRGPFEDGSEPEAAAPEVMVSQETVLDETSSAEAEPHEAEAHEAEAHEAEAHDVGANEAGATGSDEPAEESGNGDAMPPLPPPETVGGDADAGEEVRERRMPRFMRSYKIQEVIKRRQILLIQVVKEERGTKGAALTTYISLAGRFCVLMPNSPRGGGISRKITSAADRRRLKEITAELDIPRGMGMIVRTAGANRPKPEIKRDAEYLLRLWDDIRDHTMRSVAPALIYEEASLIKRAIRDVYSRDVDEILVDGEEGWKAARDFMRMLMPSHAKKVILWRGDGQPLFAKHAVDAQLDSMLQPTVQLKSGGYLVINQTEALVAIDVNSGRSTRERGIEETALRTNLEAAGEVARQLRLRDLAGLVVIDFIDMESKKHNAMVERRMKEALKDDRARIQVGSISHFGLLEMSRQRLRPSLAESSFVTCAHCGGIGLVRSTESAAIHVLRHIEEEGAKRRAAEIMVNVATAIAMYVLNAKRDRLREIETRYGMRVLLNGDDTLIPPAIRIDRIRAQVPGEMTAITPDSPPQIAAPSSLGASVLAPPAVAPSYPEAEADEAVPADDEDEVMADAATDEAEEPGSRPVPGETAEEGERRRRRRRRRRGGRREDGAASGEAGRPQRAEPVSAEAAQAAAEPFVAGDEGDAEDGEQAPVEAVGEAAGDAPGGEEPGAEGGVGEDGTRPRRRGRRGGRRRRREPGDEALPAVAALDAEQPDLLGSTPYRGPTPANPFGGDNFDIFDVMDQVEREAERPAAMEPVVAEPPVGAAVETVMVETVATATARTEAIPEPEPVTAAPAASEPVAIAPAMAAPAQAELAIAEQPAPAIAAPANDVAQEPAIRPIVIGTDEAPPVEKKRGWWRR
jgi:ribonuclease E